MFSSVSSRFSSVSSLLSTNLGSVKLWDLSPIVGTTFQNAAILCTESAPPPPPPFLVKTSSLPALVAWKPAARKSVSDIRAAVNKSGTTTIKKNKFWTLPAYTGSRKVEVIRLCNLPCSFQNKTNIIKKVNTWTSCCKCMCKTQNQKN